MIAIFCTLITPICAMLVLAIFGGQPNAGRINIFFSAITFLASLGISVIVFNQGAILFLHNQFYLDSLSICFLILTTFILGTTAIFSHRYMRYQVISGKISHKSYRLYHILYQAFSFTMLLALTTNNLGTLWVAVEGATLATALLVGLYRTPEAIEAAWKYFMLCIVGIALALFGTICVYFSAQNIVAASDQYALLWTVLHQNASLLNPQALAIAFVFLFVGYGTKIGLVPFHYWLPDAHSESPAPMSALLSGLLLNLGLYAILRFKIIVEPALGNHLTDGLMVTFGLLSFFVAALLMYRQKNIKRMFSYSSIEHLGLITFAFGLGNSIATFAALLYVMMHSLIKSAIFMNVGDVIMIAKTQNMDKIRGLMQLQPLVGWGLLISTLAILGLPPFGIFISEVLILISAVQQHLWMALIIILGLLISIAGLLNNLHPVIYGKSNAPTYLGKISSTPMVLHLGLALWLGLYVPSWLVQILQQATNLLVK